ncbi:hypothetical protein [Tepidibacillus marianensis]|uniref:hypothetical protein n=1 Tax=Tepidibacillus marianensis TaxID=3131995 RepID=UPI0030CCA0F9
MGKQNILILNRMNAHHYYYKNRKPIIDLNKYNVYIITSRNKAGQFPLEDFEELYSMDTNQDEKVFELACHIHNVKGIHKVIALAERNIEIVGKIRELAMIEGLLPNSVKKVRNKLIMKQTLVGLDFEFHFLKQLNLLNRPMIF